MTDFIRVFAVVNNNYFDDIQSGYKSWLHYN